MNSICKELNADHVKNSRIITFHHIFVYNGKCPRNLPLSSVRLPSLLSLLAPQESEGAAGLFPLAAAYLEGQGSRIKRLMLGYRDYDLALDSASPSDPPSKS